MKEYKTLDGQDIFDIAVSLYGSASYVYKLAKDNSISINDVLPEYLVYDETVKDTVLSPLVVSAELDTNLNQTYYPADNQSIFDLCLMTNGSFDGLVELVKGSTIESINKKITVSDRFTYQDSKNDIKRYLALTKRVFAFGVAKVSRLREHDNSFREEQFS